MKHEPTQIFDTKRNHKFLSETRTVDERDSFIRNSERRLLMTLFIFLGVSYLGLMAFKLENKWFGIAILVCWIAFSAAIIVRRVTGK